MSKRFSTPARAAALALTAFAAGPASALQIDNGDIVGVFVKNGSELIVNLGPFQAGTIDLTGLFPNAGFNGTPKDAKFIGLAVEDPGRTVDFGQGVVPLENVIYTCLEPDPMPEDGQIERAMNSVDASAPGATVWFNLLRSLSGTDSEVIDSTASFSYESVLGLGTDAIGNNFTISTAGVVDGQGMLSIPIYSDVRGYESFGGPATVYETLGQIEIDGEQVTFSVPEAAALLQTVAGVAVLGGLGAARRRRTAQPA